MYIMHFLWLQTKEETSRANVLNCEAAVEFRIMWEEGTIYVGYGDEITRT